MLMGNKKPQLSGHNWFIVLNPLKSEIERTKIAHEIARVFRIPADEAMDLVANTPIILLDSLSYATALQIKQYFRAVASDLVVSNDSILKRRCYRAVWPSPPDLAFLRGTDIKNPPKAEEGEIPAEEAIKEIRSWVQTENGVQEQDTSPLSGQEVHSGRHFKALLEEERERLLKENVGLRENLNQLYRSLEKSQSELCERGKLVETAQFERKQKEKEVQELQTLLNHAEEKYEMLREEFRQTRQYFEEKLVAGEKRSEEFLRQIEERESVNRELLEEKQLLQKSFHAAKSDILREKDDRERVDQEWSEKADSLARELETQKKIVAELTARMGTAEEGRKLAQSSEQRLTKELELQNQQTKRWESKASDLEKEVARAKETFEGQIKSWQLRLAQLESREHELEKARKQVRELQQQLEHRELIQRKRELSESYAAKESQLKSLVKQQEKLENEIRHREEELRKLLHEQETLEREIIEIKQAQRHLGERFKKENLTNFSQNPNESRELFSPRPSLPEASHD
ncbi:MAG: Chromosome partition protein Smc [Candidatus Omnitrophica bacterium ADurb.Bin277]|nr:MAG: Chromosome partition protein Smc [Candidatus Omnitrophica bacterium ADurb.Bin277]